MVNQPVLMLIRLQGRIMRRTRYEIYDQLLRSQIMSWRQRRLTNMCYQPILVAAVNMTSVHDHDSDEQMMTYPIAFIGSKCIIKP
jgi:hypothetical protein